MRIPRLIASTAALVALATHAQAGALVAADGKSDWRIVISTNALPSERYAAEELRDYIEKISGAELPIVPDNVRPEEHEILLGDSAHLRKLALKIPFDKLSTDGFKLDADRQRLVIAGGKPRGTLYGVYTFLEEQLGVRWFAPDLEVVPRTNRLVLPALHQTQVPALEYREVFWSEMMHNPVFAARHRINGPNYQLTEKFGGPAVVYFPFVHSLDALIPPDLYEKHPEYFPLIGGKRVNGYVQRCLSNPEVIALAIQRVRQWIKDHPEATIISISQNDTGNWCQCDECRSFDDTEGSPCASMLRFVNTIADELEPEHPKLLFDTLAYQYTRKPPRTLRPRRNVIVRLCSIECCFAHPLESCSSEANRRFREDILAWLPVAPKLYVWDYTPNFAHYQQPFPNFEVLGPNVEFFVKHGVKGLFEEGNNSEGGHGEMEPLRAYLLAKALWNPGTDLKRHQDEFLAAYYGQAAPKIGEYVELMERQVRDGKTHAHIYDKPSAAYLNEAFLSEGDRLLAQAQKLAENDTVRARVQIARLPIWYIELVTGRVQGDARADLLLRFLDIAHKAGVSNISEGGSLQEWEKAMHAH